MRDLPLPTFPIADLDLPWRLGAHLCATIGDQAPAPWWASFRLVVARAFATRRSNHPPAATRWERA